jgi:hypothetical protein
MMILLVVWYVYFLLAPARNRAFLGTMRCGAAGLGSVVSGAASFAGAAEAGGAAEAEAASNAAEGMGGGGGSDGSGGATGFFVRGLRGSFVADGTFGAAVGGNGGCARESSDCSKSLTLTGCFLTPTSFLRPSMFGGAPAGGGGADIIFTICASNSATVMGVFASFTVGADAGLAAFAAATSSMDNMRALETSAAVGTGLALPRPAPLAEANPLASFSGIFGCTKTSR